MPKYGSGSVFYLVGGRSLLGINPKTLSSKVMALHEDATGLGDTIAKSLPTGVLEASLQHGGAFFDTTSLHDVLRDVADDPQETASVICAGFGGDTIGQPFVGYSGVYTGEYETLCEIGKLTKANTRFLFNGAYDDGVILHPLAARTTDTNGTTVDQLAGTTAGGAGYVQCTAFSGFSGAVVKVQHSTDDSSWSDLITFTTIAAAPTAERIALASGATVNRYVRAMVDVTGTGSITFCVGFNRG
jgi:hypothetical protein